tara:strand:+ start:1347 stop:2009 length:663 start_codon:yes stop_codon:yes gene_type:complete
MEMRSDFYTARGTHVFFKDDLDNKDIDVEQVVATVESRIPEHLLSELETIVIGHFEEFDERNINAFYRDGILHITHIQDNEKDLVDDIIHEIAHSIEGPYGFEIYGDQSIKDEFLRKRKILHDKLWALGHKAPLQWFMNTEYDQEFDDFLLKKVGYDKLRMICMGLFISAYAPTSLREYFATGFTDFYLQTNHSFLQKVSPALTKKLILLQDIKNLDTAL